jgi:isopentenyl-diphosphate Delta-isomerase
MSLDNEIYYIVDKNDCVIGQASRKYIHKNKLLHRSVYILVFNSLKHLFLQKRSLCKDESPGLWDVSCAGHVDAGESYVHCAHRELFEELNIQTTLKPFIKITARQETHGEHVQVYKCVTDDVIKINPKEISEGAFFEFSQIQEKLSINPTQFTSSFKFLFNKMQINENKY